MTHHLWDVRIPVADAGRIEAELRTASERGAHDLTVEEGDGALSQKRGIIDRTRRQFGGALTGQARNGGAHDTGEQRPADVNRAVLREAHRQIGLQPRDRGRNIIFIQSSFTLV